MDMTSLFFRNWWKL